MKVGQEAVLLARIQFQRVKHIGEVEAVHNDPGLI